MRNVVYAEPYSGGAGAAINLLINNKVDSIQINDISIGIFSFWYFLINESDKFLKLFENTPVDLEEWHKQRTIFKTAKKPSIELGFATFFLSRTNRSGILYAGPMGGQNPKKQAEAKYKLDCRYNKQSLYDKLVKIIKKRKHIQVFNEDALIFLNKLRRDNTFVYLDPPYYRKGKSLYLNFYKHEDHSKLSVFLKNTDKFKWILSYDNVDEVKELYSGYNLYEFSLIYTVQNIKKGSELLIHSKDLVLSDFIEIKRKRNNIEIKRIERINSKRENNESLEILGKK